MILQLPPEIAFHIIHALEDDDASVNSASLVCKTWQYPAQQHLFRTLNLTLLPERDLTCRLEGLGSTSAAHVREYVDGLVIRSLGYVDAFTQNWLDTHGELLARVLRMLPLARLTRFTLDGAWIRDDEDDDTPQEASPEVLQCIREICAGPALRILEISGQVPSLSLLSHCGPSLKELYTSYLHAELVPQNTTPLGRQAPIHLEVLRLDRNNADYIQSGKTSIEQYMLDPQALFSLKSLRLLEVVGESPFEGNLSCILTASMGSLEDLKVSFRDTPSSDFSLGLQSAVNLKNLSFSSQYRLNNRELALFMDWLLRELTSRAHALPRLSLTSISLEIPVHHIADMESKIAGALSDALSVQQHYPELQGVTIKLRPWYSAASVEFSHRERLELDMHALKERGVLRLQWE
ncbi:hypothetical protein BKA70DRAFT_1499351 [Coprinopsis sp. MPI-PUGE-AT-0042]|nr:hypothetical protein BKA70DRAFT_1499351 [Coprinopsis sp. MPI-PUGE-AT-0042]